MIDNLFSGHYYFHLDYTDINSVVTVTNNTTANPTNKYIRCVRDLTPGEVAKLNRIK